jgi:hypothetical protein
MQKSALFRNSPEPPSLSTPPARYISPIPPVLWLEALGKIGHWATAAWAPRRAAATSKNRTLRSPEKEISNGHTKERRCVIKNYGLTQQQRYIYAHVHRIWMLYIYII